MLNVAVLHHVLNKTVARLNKELRSKLCLLKLILMAELGTRGPMDVVEIPSHLMEHLVRDGRVLHMFARHATTGESIPQAVVSTLSRRRAMFASLDRQHEVWVGPVLVHTALASCAWEERKEFSCFRQLPIAG